MISYRVNVTFFIFSIFQPSSCLSDRDGDQIYDYATKYRHQMRQNQAKMLMSPQGYVNFHFEVELPIAFSVLRCDLRI